MFAKKRVKKVPIIVSALTMLFSVLTGFPAESKAATITLTGSAAAPAHKLSLWYQQPASNWESQALPIGNGYMGGMVFGGVDQEHIQFNEKTLWTGGPDASDSYSYGNTDGAASHLASVRSKLDAGNISGAGSEANTYLTGNSTGFGAYQNFGDMYFDFALPGASTVSNYRRELDLQDGIARVSYTYNGVDYLREYFVSYPDKVMVMRLSASQNGQISLDVRPTSAQGGTVTASGDTITIRGNVSNNQMLYESQVKVTNEGGTITPANGKISVSGANALTVVMAAGTDYANSYPTYKGTDPHNQVTSVINSASIKSYSTLRSNHMNDYQALFNRVSLNLGESIPQIPTDQLLTSYRTTRDKALEVLFYQYGRYMLISSSRSGSLPANLQGVWNNSNTPPWESDYHFNVNIQMNYWPAEVANLDETMVPLIDYVESLMAPGRVSAEKHFGVTGGGWTVNTMNNPFGFTAPGWDFYWGWAPSANAFITNNVWEYYKFSGDTAKLNRIYPVLKEASQFWTKYLVTDTDGTLVSNPCYSPEQGDISKGCAFDQQLAWDLFTNTIEASEKLNIDSAFRSDLITKRNLLSPIKVGSYGQIQEWKQDIDDPNNTHRHVSQLVGLYPGKQINMNTQQWFDAAKVTLMHRGDGGTGWSKANKINLWARLLDGTHAHTILRGQLTGSTLSNLFDTHPPFQIDGNFGATSGMSEMLLQSHLDNIHILPALPSAWPAGSYSGLKARNGFEVGVTWAQSRATGIQIKSLTGNKAVLYYPNIDGAVIEDQNGASVTYTALNSDQIEFNTGAGSTYTVSSIPPAPPSSTTMKVDDRDTSVTYNGTWSTYDDASDYSGTEKYSGNTGDYAELTFTGTSVKLISMKQQNMGIVDVYLDGDLDQGSIDLYAPSTSKQVVAYAKTGLSNSSHTIKVVNKGTKNPSSIGTISAIDAFEYASEAPPVTNVTIPQWQMTASATSEELENENNPASMVLDGDPDTIWHTKWDLSDPLPESITLNLGGTYDVNKIKVLPRQGGGSNGMITAYNVYASTDGIQYTKVVSGTWAKDTTEKTAEFPAKRASFIKLEATAGQGGWASAAEMNVYRVTEVPVTGVQLDKVQVSLKEGQSAELVATLLPENATNKNVTWASSNDTVAKVEVKDGKAVVSALKEGAADITVTTVSGNYTAVSKITVQKGDDTQLALTTLSAAGTVQTGQEFNVQLGLGSVTQSVYAQDMKMDYDSTVFEFVSAHSLRDDIQLVETRKDTPGKLRFILASLGDGKAVTGDAGILELKFKAKAATQPATGTINVTDATLGDAQGAELKAQASSVNVSITTLPLGIPGDVNHDNRVSIGDLAIIAANYGKTSSSQDWEQIKQADVTGDGEIDIDDLALVARKIIE
ncbi:hypothetical protein PAECIP111891_00466 [Paenibacillus allorhizoplanae]|uniref:Dockerin domain-containing protein n=1 Tax=Paenibacillus allorhizoplanae TaxID=2905648 RepID=A0ABN8G269_9BACL|nr:glycoside hydrolase N-terminal domain-containing protein [Paenibacillus allorhizoplanae]CAH1192956.1 hypothetical protein PAECIP111891_00466 [Paenibacillus allorhizoplanae]